MSDKSQQNTFFTAESDKYDDDTLMPFGKYKDEPLSDVPDSYFLFLYNDTTIKDRKLLAYIEENLDAIKNNVKK